MAEIEILPQKIVDTKTIILKSKFDSKMMKLQGEKLKPGFFTRFGFLKPKPQDVVLLALSKYYEPYILIGGKYSIDYCKRHRYALKVKDKTQALFIEGRKLRPEPLSPKDSARVINLVAEEHSHYENETYVILDRLLQEVPPEKLCFAPFQGELENGSEIYFDLRKPRISLDEEITFLRSKIAKRPSDFAEIIKEIFEINDRIIIYSPIYELTYKNIKNGKKVTTLINGITGNMNIGKFESKTIKKRERSLEASPKNRSAVQTRFFEDEPERSQVRGKPNVPRPTDKNQTENLIVKEKVKNVTPSTHQPEKTFMSNAEKATHVATDFMARLDYKQGQFPSKLFVDGETDVAELKHQKRTTSVQIDTKKRKPKNMKFKKQRLKRVSSLQKEVPAVLIFNRHNSCLF